MDIDVICKCDMTLLDVFLHLFLIACENGTYGQECKGICGNCLEGNSCSHTNGTCLNGCETGYFGDLCKTGKYLNNENFLFHFLIEVCVSHLYSYSCRIYINSKPKCIVTYTVLLVMWTCWQSFKNRKTPLFPHHM